MSFNESLHAFYDVRVSPISFDVVPFLLEAERTRLNNKLEHIHMVIVSPLKLSDAAAVSDALDPGQAQWLINNVILASCQLLPSIKNVTVCDDADIPEWILHRAKENVFPKNYTLKQPIEHVHQGFAYMAGHLGRLCNAR